jgi:uncharacterized membrane protein
MANKDLRFNHKTRGMRMFASTMLVIVAVPVAMLAISGQILGLLIALPFVMLYQAAKALIDGLIAAVWYAKETFKTNWKE